MCGGRWLPSHSVPIHQSVAEAMSTNLLKPEPSKLKRLKQLPSPLWQDWQDKWHLCVAQREVGDNTLKILYAVAKREDEDPIYYLPCDGILVQTPDYEDIRRILPLHVYSGWAQSKLDKKDKWVVFTISDVSVYNVIPKTWRGF